MRKGFYFGLQISLFRDRQGLKVAFRFALLKVHLEKGWILKKNLQCRSISEVPVGNPELTPTVETVEMLTEVPTWKGIEPEGV